MDGPSQKPAIPKLDSSKASMSQSLPYDFLKDYCGSRVQIFLIYVWFQEAIGFANSINKLIFKRQIRFNDLQLDVNRKNSC
jgi:hypothetical protein